MVVKVLFVCMGNICRSPMAEGAFRAAAEKAGLLDRFEIDSAGTIGYHAGSPPDKRAIATAKERGIDISLQRSRKVEDADFSTFDYILVMDHDNLRDVMERCPDEYKDRISLFLTHAPDMPLDEMPDPYQGHISQFDSCYLAAMDASDGLLAKIKAERF
ncbi:low molecular weight protein-tyrosine-phosphatase [Kordiimonas sp.]|uniref:low molecular weight protein-tyrosine-phosphatase n=1 Tax=Kordiimonas sp. TaxID=1970157 RepID=UPI003A9395B6